jgi:hypothetical protein
MAQVLLKIRQRYGIAQEDFPLFLSSPEPLLFEFGEARVELRPVADEAPSTEHAPRPLICTVAAPINVSDKRKRLLDQLVQGRMPDGSKGIDPDSAFPEEDAEFYAGIVDEQGNLRHGLPPRQFLPETLNLLLEEASKITFDLAESTLRMIRWRAGLQGPPTILTRDLFIEWSEDDENWHGIWNGSTITVSVSGRSPFRDQWREFVERNTAPIPEPLGHELYHEAEFLLPENPRSAVLMLVTAAEVAVKQCIAALAPDTTWLMENMPSPPVVALLLDYMPQLNVVRAFGDRLVCPPPKEVSDELKAMIQVRNRLTHVGYAPPSQESLMRKFEIVRDLLWLLDYYVGQDWAMEHVSQRTREGFIAL